MAARKNFSLEHRAAQSALIRLHRPWEQSTGPRTAAGKAIASRNARLQGARAEVAGIRAEVAASFRELRRLARLMQRTRGAQARESEQPPVASMRPEGELKEHGAAAVYLRKLRG
jgi:hypothetical protein